MKKKIMELETLNVWYEGIEFNNTKDEAYFEKLLVNQIKGFYNVFNHLPHNGHIFSLEPLNYEFILNHFKSYYSSGEDENLVSLMVHVTLIPGSEINKNKV